MGNYRILSKCGYESGFESVKHCLDYMQKYKSKLYDNVAILDDNYNVVVILGDEEIVKSWL